jgi:hypothetical protein
MFKFIYPSCGELLCGEELNTGGIMLTVYTVISAAAQL